METSAPKRRKTSPTTSVPVDESNEPASSDSATRRSSRLNRPSFASPTKASLARSNPDILQRRTSSRGSQPNEELPAPAASEPGSPTSHYSSGENEPEARGLQEDGEGNKDNATAERPTTISPEVRRVGGGLSMKPRRTPSKPSPRPLPPPSAEEEELIDPFKGRRLRRSPPPGVIPEVEPEEPELPPTPTQQGLSDPSSVITSPPGIHNTPSKKPRRSRVLAARMNSSPLKQPPLLPPELIRKRTVEDAATSRLTKDPLRDEPRRKRRKRKSHPARQVEEVDPLADKKALRDSLLTEVAQLEEDLKVATRENERLYQLQGSHGHTTELPDPEEQDRIFDVLSRYALPPEKEAPPDPMEAWLEAAMNPIAFLPFGQANAISLPPFVMPSAEKEEKTDPPPPISHHPVPMTANEELPYLQVFTPLTFTSSITTTQQQEPQEPLLQHHSISVASSPPGLFVATINMTVNTKTLSITELTVPRLDPSAISELGPYLEKIIRGSGNNSALTRNVSVVTWAMGEWVRLATRRARFWYAVQHELGSTEKLAQCARAMRQSMKRKPGRSRSRYEEDGEDEEQSDATSDKARPSKADLVSLLGRTSFDLDLLGAAGADEINNESLIGRIHWRIDFDWTGEARSKIGFLLSAPAKWHANDEKRSLAGLPDTFDKLLQESKDPLQAVKIVVALIVGEGRP
ncbi:hypothetical protein HD806DRAFT_504390 [Xylariaceae sp. AK1471]|nr:hypothetical protein HD806DRAFT_504390 [Xylariaceae sp. AK1471]